MWQLMEFEHGEFRITHTPSRRRPVAEYFEAQARFRHLRLEEIEAIQREIDASQ
jgi:pyruvate ferredoxin oxidoreductase beta subunit